MNPLRGDRDLIENVFNYDVMINKIVFLSHTTADADKDHRDHFAEINRSLPIFALS